LEEIKLKEEIMEENAENNYLSDLEDVSIKYEGYERNNNINYETNVIKKFNVCFYFDLNKDKKYSFNFNTDEFNADEYHIYNLIKYIVKKINDSNIVIKDSNDNYSVSLKDIDEENIDFYINNYEIKPFDSLTKNDFPNFSPTDPLKSINEENISFFSKNPLNILLIKLL
jgi:hypothetical protein